MTRIVRSVVFVCLALKCVLATMASRPVLSVPEETPLIGGLPVRCGNARTIVQPMHEMAAAIPDAILLSPTLFALPSKVQLFIYAHECAHHALGSSEAEADCSAVRTGRDEHWLNRDDVKELGSYFANLSGDSRHVPGPSRVAHIVECFEGQADESPPPALS